MLGSTDVSSKPWKRQLNKILRRIFAAREVFLVAWYWVSWTRRGRLKWTFLTRGGRRLPQYSQSSSQTGAQDYSRGSFGVFKPLTRVKWPLLVLAGIPTVDTTSARVLIVGPRYETEYFLARALGFKKSNITMVDLLPLSKRIYQADMHNLPFVGETYDAVICGWTLSYSLTPSLATTELLRVTKPGGYVIFGVEKADPTKIPSATGILVGAERIQTKRQFEKLCHPSAVEAFFDSDFGGNVLAVIRK